jgi:nucleoside-diphosphate-sugar epimerase
MEQVVLSRGTALVLRLPQVVGPNANPHTLIKFIADSILHRRKMRILRNARRNLLDVEDLVRIVNIIVKKQIFDFEILNIASPISFTAVQIVQAMERALELEANYEMVEGGSTYEIDITRVLNLYREFGFAFDDNYLNMVISKYYSPILGDLAGLEEGR